MIAFWIAAGLLAAAASMLMLWMGGRTPAAAAGSAEATLYRRHLAEVDELRARGLLGEEEHRAARAEAGRRLLAAEESAPSPLKTGTGGRRLLLATALLTPLAAGGLYILTGRPGTADQPYAQRLAAWRGAPPEALPPRALAALAEDAARRRPEDPNAWRMLGRAYLLTGEGFLAVRTLERAAQLGGTADDWTALGEALALRNDGAPDAAAAQAFTEALRRDPGSVPARYGLAQAAAAAGDSAGSAAQLRALAASLPPGDERRALLETEAARLTRP
jgi:cytochrome c-type biogenesis protein CcmH